MRGRSARQGTSQGIRHPDRSVKGLTPAGTELYRRGWGPSTLIQPSPSRPERTFMQRSELSLLDSCVPPAHQRPWRQTTAQNAGNWAASVTMRISSSIKSGSAPPLSYLDTRKCKVPSSTILGICSLWCMAAWALSLARTFWQFITLKGVGNSTIRSADQNGCIHWSPWLQEFLLEPACW